MFSSWLTLPLFAFTSTLLIKWLINYISTLIHLPPGPWGLPLIGYLPWMTTGRPHEIFTALGKRYGGLFSVGLGTETIVVLNDWPTIKATLVDQPRQFSGRPEVKMLAETSSRKDLGLNDGPAWKKQRNLAVQCLRSVGFSSRPDESLITDMVDRIITKFEKLDNQSVAMDQDTFYRSLLSLSYRALIDGPCMGTENDLAELEDLQKQFLHGFRSESPLNVFLWLRFCPPNGFGYWEFMRRVRRLHNYYKNVIEGRLKLGWKEGCETDVMDHYITAIKQKEAEDKEMKPPYNVEHLIGTVRDLFSAATDTTNNTLLWGLLHLVSNPAVQVQVQKEVDTVVGRQRMPSLDDLARLPYLDAFVKEVHRHTSVVPLAIPHRTTSTVSIAGSVIPQGTTCMPNIYAVHHDPHLWEQPESFRPERFIDANGKPLTPPYLIPFSIGPRMCIGQPLAESALRLLFGCLIHRFNFSLPKDRPKPSIETTYRLTLIPSPYHLHIQVRKD